MANSTLLYACTSDGLVILTRPGTLPEWLPPRKTLEGRVITSAWAEPGPPIHVVAATSSGEMVLSENGGRTWVAVEMPAPVLSVFTLGEAPGLFATMRGGALATSTDSGTSWDALPNLPVRGNVRSLCEGGATLYLLVAQDGSSMLLAGDPRRGKWRTIVAGEMISALACDRAGKDLYAAFTDGVRVSSDGGMRWATLPGSPGDVTTLAAIPGVAGKPVTFVAGTTLGLSTSQDGGATWRAAGLGEVSGTMTLARDPERRDRLYAATATGYLFESGNRGQTWERINPHPLQAASYLYVLRI